MGLGACGFCLLLFLQRHSETAFGLAAVEESEVELRDGPLIVVDAGHGGVDGGAESGGLLEKELTLDVAGRLVEELRRLGLRTVETRTGDEAVSLEERTRVANSRGEETLFVSVHFNTSNSSSPQGIETYHTSPKSLAALAGIKKRYGIPRTSKLEDDRNRLLAEAVQAALVEGTGAPDRGVKNKSLRVTREALCPSVLVECAYLTNPGEAKKLKTARYRQTLAAAIAGGVEAYLSQAEQSNNRRFGLLLEGEPTVESVSAPDSEDHSRKEGSKGQSGTISSL